MIYPVFTARMDDLANQDTLTARHLRGDAVQHKWDRWLSKDFRRSEPAEIAAVFDRQQIESDFQKLYTQEHPIDGDGSYVPVDPDNSFAELFLIRTQDDMLASLQQATAMRFCSRVRCVMNASAVRESHATFVVPALYKGPVVNWNTAKGKVR